jgi:hypothetical protein
MLELYNIKVAHKIIRSDGRGDSSSLLDEPKNYFLLNIM